MHRHGSIIIIEDDEDDREFLNEVITEVISENNYSNSVVFLNNGQEALAYLSEVKIKPFMIISDINMPKLNGFDLRKIIFEDDRINQLCIPYIFLTTSNSNSESIDTAYKLSIQGYFIKPTSFEDYKSMITDLFRYWKRSITPSEVK